MVGGMEIFDCCCSCCDPGYISSGDEIEDDDAEHLSHVGTAAYNILRRRHNHQHHTCWNVTSGHLVAVDETPKNGWQRTEEYPREGHSDWFPEKLACIMKKTEHWCDVMSLGPPDGLFMTHFQDALKVIAENAKGKKSPIIVRMMFGNIIGMPVNCNSVIKALTKRVPKDANIRLWVGAWRRGVSWNHAKIIAVDGKYLHTGGHNLWDYHYLKHNPVHDLSIEMQGRIAHDGHNYANQQWAFIQFKQDTCCGQFVDKLPDGMPLVAKTRVTISEFPRKMADEFAPMYRARSMPRYDTEGEVPLISIGRLGTILKFARPADNAFIAMWMAAKKIIRMALQDIGPVCVPGTKRALPGCVWPKEYLEPLARSLWERDVDIEIALSNPGSIPGGLGATEACYGNGWSCVDVAAEIIKTVKHLYPKATDAELRSKLERNLRVCFIRNKRGNAFDDGMTMGMHAKHFIIDDVCTYVGSQNIYVCDLAEWGVVIDHEESTKKILREYFMPMWGASYTTEDCDVSEVMAGMGIDRDGEPESLLLKHKHQSMAARMDAHGSTGEYYFDEKKEDGIEEVEA